jgi:hypothetical protein
MPIKHLYRNRGELYEVVTVLLRGVGVRGGPLDL